MPVLEMTDMNMRGCAVARLDSAVVFVPQCADGDVCEVEITGGGKNFITGRAVELLTPSLHRCNSGCEVYGKCGGCTLRHVTYSHELEVKVRSVEQSFRKNGIGAKVSSIQGTSHEGYRNKVILHRSGAGLTYYSTESHEPVYPEQGGCALLPKEFEEIRAFCEDLLEERGLDLSLLLRRGDGGQIAMTVICTEPGVTKEELRRLADTVMDRFGYVISVHAVSDDVNAPGCKAVLIRGEETLPITVGGVIFRVSPTAFFQVNTEGASILCDLVCGMLGVRDGERYADLYCGTGMFALTLAKRYERSYLVGIEINSSAIISAKANAVENGVSNARFLLGDAAAFPKELEGLSGLVVDPPRAGLSKKARELILKHSPERIVYVSCNPDTLARDVASLSGSYKIAEVRCVDMFPRTGHVESVVCLSREKADDYVRISVHTKDLKKNLEA